MRSFLDRILQENAELRAREAQLSQATPANTPWQHNSTPNDGQNAAGNQILEECDWFAHTGTSDTPIWIGEISDSAFATRFRQFASSSQAPCHIPRTQFASDDAICGLAGTTPAWPSPSRARLLAETARQFLQRNYHIVRQSEVLPRLRTSSFDEESTGASYITRAKMWALFAIGELRSSRCPSSANNIPGLAYFSAASNAIRMVNERPQLDVIETALLLVSSLNTCPATFSFLAYGYYWLCIPSKQIVGIPHAPLWAWPCALPLSWASTSILATLLFRILN